MATHDYVLDNATGANFRADLNLALAAIVSNNSNSSAPTTTYAYQWWADTTANILKIRNSANDAWISLFTLAGGVDVDSASNFNADVTFQGANSNIVFNKGEDDLIFDDNSKAVFGTSSDGLEIFHNASDSIINDNGTGSLKLQLGGSTKAEIVSGGLTVTGTVTATTFSGALSGNATTATTATNANHVSVADNESTNENNLVPFIEDASATGNVGLESDGDFTYNPSTGTVTATKFVGDGSGLTGVGGTTINNNADNRLITGSGSANTLEGESELTYSSPQLKLISTGTAPQIRINTAADDGSGTRLTIGRATGSNNFVNGAVAGDSAITYSGKLLFGDSSANLLATLDSSGRLLVGTATEGDGLADNFTVADSSNCGITIRSGSSSVGSIFFSDATSGGGEYQGQIVYDHSSDYIKAVVNGTETIRITSSQDIQCRAMSNTVSQSSTPSDVAPTDVFHFGNRQYRVSRFASLTASGSGTGTFNMGRLWIEDSSVLRVMAQVQRFDATANKCGYIDFICMKNRGTGLQGFTTISTQSVGSETYSVNANSSNTHFLDINFASGDGGVIYVCTLMADVTSKTESF